MQEFSPDKDLHVTRRQIESVNASLDVETWAASPDGKRIVVSVREYSSSIVMARRLPDVSK